MRLNDDEQWNAVYLSVNEINGEKILLVEFMLHNQTGGICLCPNSETTSRSFAETMFEFRCVNGTSELHMSYLVPLPSSVEYTFGLLLATEQTRKRQTRNSISHFYLTIAWVLHCCQFTIETGATCDASLRDWNWDTQQQQQQNANVSGVQSVLCWICMTTSNVTLCTYTDTHANANK